MTEATDGTSKTETTAVGALGSRVNDLLDCEPSLAEFLPRREVSAQLAAPGNKAIDIVMGILSGYADRPALAARRPEIVTDPRTGRRSAHYAPDFAAISYGQLEGRIRALANVWAQGGAHAVPLGGRVCILGFASADYVTIDMACIYAGAISVPLQTNLASGALADMVREADPSTFVTSLEFLDKAVDVVRTTDVRSLVIMDYEPRDDDQRERFEAACAALSEDEGRRVVTFDELIAEGARLPAAMLHRPADDEDPLLNIMYTSGSTGVPKGAMFTDRLIARWWTPAEQNIPSITLIYQPLNHSLGRNYVMSTLSQGGLCCFALRSDMSTLFEDMRTVRPTTLGFVPRVAEMLYGQYQDEVMAGLAAGLSAEAAGEAAMDVARNATGGRLLMSSIGTAPTTPELQQFLQDCLGAGPIDIYGSTETGGVTFNGVINRGAVEDYKLIDVPELEYYSTDKPYPRGQLLLKTKSAVVGYYNNPELTAELFDEDGYLVTGDIFEQHGPDRIKYIDRKNNVMKLAQGEYVAIAQLETLFAAASPLIEQVYLWGTSTASFLLGVIVPNMAEVHRQIGDQFDDEALKGLMRDVIHSAAQSERLRAYEVPRDFLIETEPFTVANGLLSQLGKYLRPAFRERYGDRLQALYAEIADRQRSTIEMLRRGDSGMSVEETVRRAFVATLGLEDLAPDDAQSFGELGGDSLVAVSLSLLLEELFDVPVPVSVILHPAATQRMLVEHVERALSGAGNAVGGFEAVHGNDPASINAADLTLDKFFAAPADIRPRSAVAADVRVVLVTGATGFLGRFVCLEWLERMARTGGKVICIIRAKDRETAGLRLQQAFHKGDPRLVERFRHLSARLEICVGDLSAPQLGLDPDEYDRLAEEVDLIVHVAALVNHVMDYRQLFEPNVQGTAELIRLALQGKPKSFDYVSSMAAAMLEDGSILEEGGDIRKTRPSWSIGGEGYAKGYGISKWAGEILLRDAHEKYGIPVNIYRSDMVLAHSEYSGQINIPDMFTRLLFSLVHVGIAPESFYEMQQSGSRNVAQYGGLPADFIARTMVEVAAQRDKGYATYHVENPHQDGISLDSIVDWLVDEGYPIIRIAEYAEWAERFEAQMKELPEERRRQSSLPIINQLKRPLKISEKPVSCEKFRERVRALGTHPSGDIPGLTRAFIRKCLDDMVVLEMIDKGEGARAV